MQVFCDECNKDFEIELLVQDLDGGVEKVHFFCPECGHEYMAYYTDASIREKQTKMKKLQEKYKAAAEFRDIKQTQKLFRQMERFKKEIGKDMDRLRKRIEA